MNESLSGKRVLVVEDEMLVLMGIEDVLENLGCRSITTAATVDQALALIETQSFDAAMIDVNLDGCKSYPVADALAAHGVPFLFSTGCSGQSMEEGYRDRPFLGKPYCSTELEQAFTRLLRKPTAFSAPASPEVHPR